MLATVYSLAEHRFFGTQYIATLDKIRPSALLLSEFGRWPSQHCSPGEEAEQKPAMTVGMLAFDNAFIGSRR